MTGDKKREDRPDDRYARARGDEPGAHSGSESQARERTVRGTATADEGYRPKRGTTAGEPLKGVGTRDADRTDDPRDEEPGA
ncbi:hypothetical protein ABZ023_22400 [Streptomyces sp. NPDC006367]|uniref:hypothetical protein n=1 Tax=unclassified Streptomyces TaxID=2593676 RepID=UPI0033B136AF